MSADVTERKISSAMKELAWSSYCARQHNEGWYAKDCRELKLRSKCARCLALQRIEKMLRSALPEVVQ